MSIIRGITLGIIMTFTLVASATGAFIYIFSGFPNPEVDSFSVSSNDTGNNLTANVDATVRNNGGEGEVRVEFRKLDSEGNVLDSRAQTVYMVPGETRLFERSFEVEDAENIGLAVFAPGRPGPIRDDSPIREAIQR